MLALDLNLVSTTEAVGSGMLTRTFAELAGGQAATPLEIAHAAVFLSPPSSGYTIGPIPMIDGAKCNPRSVS